jgi:hypothetical protein
MKSVCPARPSVIVGFPFGPNLRVKVPQSLNRLSPLCLPACRHITPPPPLASGFKELMPTKRLLNIFFEILFQPSKRPLNIAVDKNF